MTSREDIISGVKVAPNVKEEVFSRVKLARGG